MLLRKTSTAFLWFLATALPLASCGGPRSTDTLSPQLRKAFDDSDYRAMWELLGRGEVFPREAYLELGRRLSSKDRAEKFTVMAMMARLPNRGQCRPFLAIARTESSEDRFRVIYNLGILGDVSAVPFLLEAAREGERVDTLAAAFSLEMISDRTTGGKRGQMPLDAAGYVLDGPTSIPGWPFKLPSLEERMEKHRQWWAEKGAELTAKRKLAEDYWAAGE